MTILPNVFHVDLPNDLANELMNCKDDDMAKAVGVEWCTAQVKDLIAHGVPSIHFYSLNATRSVYQVASKIY
jgi:methylenetetrahydrofolate reductase (NADPH)